MAAPPPCDGPATYPGNVKTLVKILKRKKWTYTQYDNKAKLDGQRFGKLKVATWNVREIAEKTEELQTELLKRKTDIAIITETEKKTKDQKT